MPLDEYTEMSSFVRSQRIPGVMNHKIATLVQKNTLLKQVAATDGGEGSGAGAVIGRYELPVVPKVTKGGVVYCAAPLLNKHDGVGSSE